MTLGDELRAGRLNAVLATARRVRFFLHGRHDPLLPDADCLRLVDDPGPRGRISVHPRDLRQLPIAGMDCVELWACEGASHGRQLQEHGASDDPEDLTAACCSPGPAAPWHRGARASHASASDRAAPP